MKRKNDCYVSNHACFLLQYHLVLVIKYRHKVIKGKLKDWLLLYTRQYFTERKINIVEINSDKDHIHILFEAYPDLNLAKFIGDFKGASSRKVRAKFNDYLSRFYYKPYFWSKSYFVCTVSERTTQVVQQYIKNQNTKICNYNKQLL